MNTCPTCGASYPSTVRLCPVDGDVLEDRSGADPNLGTLLGGKYRLEEMAGRGGMGTVYRATHVMLGKTVAVKLINRDLAPSTDVVLRFQREARAAGRLVHPNIAGVYDLGQTDDGTLYIAMEYVTGTSLKDVIQTDGPMSSERIVRIGCQIASALSVAHGHNIIHRDLKPQNVMIGLDSQGGERASLLDFGIARSYADDATKLTSTGLAVGTPQYMSPEQATGEPLDGRSDLYSLGVMLYQMLIGVVPFDAPSTPAVLIKHLNEVPERPSRRRPDVAVSPALEAIALRCLEKDPANRFQTAEQVRVALEGAGAAAATTAVMPLAAGSADGPAMADTTRTAAAAPTVVVPSGARGAVAPSAQAGSPAPSSRAGDSASGGRVHRSAGSSILLVVLVLCLVGGVGFAGYGLGYWSVPGADPAEEAGMPSSPVVPPGSDGEAASPAAGGAPLAPDAASQETPGSEAALPPASVPTTPDPASASGRVAAPPPPAPPPAGPPPAATPPAATAVPVAQEPDPPAREPAEPPRPEHPSVRFGCDGPAEVCVTLQSAIDRALGGADMPSMADESRAELLVDALVVAGTPRSQEMFGVVMVIKPYTVSFVCTDRRTDARVPMPDPTSFSLDERVGQARVLEQSRVMSAAVVKQLQAYWTARD
jgi:hypothetical protein